MGVQKNFKALEATQRRVFQFKCALCGEKCVQKNTNSEKNNARAPAESRLYGLLFLSETKKEKQDRPVHQPAGDFCV